MSVIPRDTANLLLRALSDADYALLAPGLRRTQLRMRQVLVERNEPIEQLYFFDDGVASVVSDDEEGDAVEIGLFGREGMSGSAVLLGSDRTPLQCFVQVGDPTASMIGTDDLLDACRASQSLHATLLRYVHTLNVQAAKTAAANAHYQLPERLARWLLMCHDRGDGDRIELTHEFMSIMLAVRRSGVTVTLHTLEGTGAIRNDRGLVTVLDRARLEEIAGPSYGAPEIEYRRLFGPTPGFADKGAPSPEH
jgi:CRP-like cAMP-binding protein